MHNSELWKHPPREKNYSCNGDFIKRLLKELDWTQEEFAQKSGYSERLIRKACSSGSIAVNTIGDLAVTLSSSDRKIFPEDLITDPMALASKFIECYQKYDHGMYEHILPHLAEDMVFDLKGDPNEIPFTGVYEGLAGFQRLLDNFYGIVERIEKDQFDPQFVADGGSVFVRFRERVKVGDDIGPPVWMVLQFDVFRGKIQKITNFNDTAVGREFFVRVLEKRDG